MAGGFKSAGRSADPNTPSGKPFSPDGQLDPTQLTPPLDEIASSPIEPGVPPQNSVREEKEKAIQNDPTLDQKQRKNALKDLGHEYGHRGKEFADRGVKPPTTNPVDTYKREGDKKWAAASLNFAHKHRKKLLGGSGIVGTVAVLVMSFFLLLPLKLEAIMKDFYSHEVGRAENYVDRRVQAMMFRYVYEKVTGTVASDGFYTSGSLFKTIYGNLQINKFEDKLLTEKGIKIEKTGPRSIRFTLADGSKLDADSYPKLMNLLDTDLKGRAARLAVKDVVNSTYRPIQFLKRRHMRKYLQNAFNIHRWSIPKQKDTKDASNPGGPTSTEAAIQASEIDPPSADTVSAVDCVLADNCEDPSKRATDGISEQHPPVPDPSRTGDAAAGETEAATTAKDGIKASYDELKKASGATIRKGMEAIFGKVITDGIIKAVPIVGWLSLAADIDNFLWSGRLSQIAVALHSAQYAAAAATWSSLADQYKAGQLEGTQINKIMTMLNGVENSNAVQRILFKNDNGGVKLAKENRVGSDTGPSISDAGSGNCGVTWFADHAGDPPPSSTASSTDYWTYYYRVLMGAPPTFAHTILCAIRPVLNGISGLISWVAGDALSSLASAALSTLDAAAGVFVGHSVDIIASVSSSLGTMVNLIWTPVVSGREVGADLGNILDAGWDVIGNTMCRDVLGCQNIPYSVAYNENLALANEHRAELSRLNPIAALTNTDYPESFGSQMLTLMPSTPGAAVANIGTTAIAMISNPIHLFANTFTSIFPGAHAAAAPVIEPNGVQQTGLPESVLANPDLTLPTVDIAGPPGPDGKLTGPDGHLDQYDCPVITDPNAANPCLLDVAAAQALCAGTSTDDDGGLGGNGTPGPCSDTPPGTTTTPTPPPSTAPPGSKCQVPAPGSIAGATAPPDDYTKIANYRGASGSINKRTLSMLLTAETYAKQMGVPTPLTLVQLGYNPGGVAASGGTHDGGGALDVGINSLNDAQRLNVVKALRLAGFAAWERYPDEGFSPHIHAIAIGDKQLSSSAAAQVQNYFDGLSGLIGTATDRNASVGRPYPNWAAAFCK